MKIITNELIQKFKNYLVEEEKANATIEKYVHDVLVFMAWLVGAEVTKTKVLDYKQILISSYAPASVNAFRNECKHHVTEFELIELRQRLNAIAKRDRFSVDNGGYLIKSLYFDNCYDKALNEKIMGVTNREKFRIRFYNNDTSYNMIFLIRMTVADLVNGLPVISVIM